ncbi:anosmin-1 Kallmann syndrome 1 [Andrena cerasifolii]|uniref:anosmin-1 Kallmann syndrome 1 n=1 Tax=Andrena cerasifolii TaxID=2819439 RepID=UPI004037662D
MGGSRVVETNGVGRSSRRSAREAGEDWPAQKKSDRRRRSFRYSVSQRTTPDETRRFRRSRLLFTRIHGSPLVTPPMPLVGGLSYAVKFCVYHASSTSLNKWWPWWLLLPGCLASWTKYIEEYDSIRVARCDARCGENYPDKCIDDCLSSNYTKPGYCRDKASMSPFEAACLVACDDDSRCPDLAKCCKHDCGVTCMHPLGLDDRTDLPPVPETLQIRQQKSNVVFLTWRESKAHRANESAHDKDIRYLVEERHLLGPRYLESRLSSWTVCHVSTKSYATLRGRLKTGHWYQFRVAAINGNGSRGYSQPSRPFKTREPRSPKEPQNLTLSDARLIDGKLHITLKWVKPTSDVPITFYKVFWSRLLHGPTNNSILVYHRTVLKDKNCYELKNLELKCQYFLQVQAVSLYGGRRLVSRKASKVFNSTDYMVYADVERHSHRCERYQGGLHLRRMICDCGEIKARLVWPTNHDAKGYNVSWREEACPFSQAKDSTHQRKALWKVVQTPHLDLRHLRNDCLYNVNVRNVHNDKTSEEHGASIEFSATGCQKDLDLKEKKHSRGKLVQCKKKVSRSKRRSVGLFLI